jgi:beta-glucosidase
VKTIATHNEPWCTANLGYGNAQFAPGVADLKQSIQVSHHLVLSHGLAMSAMRKVGSSAQLGIVLNQWTADPATDSAADKAAAEFEYARSVEWFMDPIFKASTRHWRSRSTATTRRWCSRATWKPRTRRSTSSA